MEALEKICSLFLIIKNFQDVFGHLNPPISLGEERNTVIAALQFKTRWLGGHTRLRERGLGGPSSDKGTDTGVLQVYMYFVEVEEITS